MTQNCIFSSPVYFDPTVKNFLPINSGNTEVLKTTSWNYNNSTCEISATSTAQTIYNGFTAGEIIISFFLFWIFLGLIFSFFVFKFFGIKIHKQQ